MNYKKLFGFGVLIYVVVFLIMSGFVAYDMGETLIAKIVALIGVAVVTYIAGRSLQAASRGQIIKYSIGWLVIVVILDVLLTLRFVDSAGEFFSDWSTIAGYIIILLLPLLTVCKSCAPGGEVSQPAAPAAPETPAAPEAPQSDAGGSEQAPREDSGQASQ